MNPVEANVLLLAARRRVFFCESLKAVIVDEKRATHVLACDTDHLDPIRHVADDFFLVSPSTSPEFIPTLCDSIRDRHIRLIIPWNDADISILNERREELSAAGAELLLPSSEHVKLFHDKRLTAEWAIAHGVAHPQVFAKSEVEFPLIVKPRWGQGSYGIKRYDSAASFHSEAGQLSENDYVLQQWIDGEEFTVDAWFDKRGQAVFVVPRRRLKVRGGEVLISKVDMAPDILSFARNVGRILNYRGLVNIQVMIANGRLYLIEMNPRFGGGSDLTIAAGANIARYALEMLWFGDIRSASPTIRNGLIMTRYLTPVFFSDDQPRGGISCH